MITNPVHSAGKSTKDLAKKIARQVAQEPLEVLKSAREQTFGAETLKPVENPQTEKLAQTSGQDRGQEENDKLKSGRRLEALNKELEDMHKQTLFKSLQEKVMSGEEVPLEEYSELTIEQKQVLKAQMEALRAQKTNEANQSRELQEPVSKKGRRLGPTRKQEAEKQQTRVEKPVPPSG